MVEHAHVYKVERLPQCVRDLAIGRARFSTTRRVVVGKYHSRSVGREGAFDDFSRVHTGAVERAAKQRFKGDYAMARVEPQTAKGLVGQVREFGAQVSGCGLRAVEHRTGFDPVAQSPSANFCAGLQCGPGRPPNARLR